MAMIDHRPKTHQLRRKVKLVPPKPPRSGPLAANEWVFGVGWKRALTSAGSLWLADWLATHSHPVAIFRRRFPATERIAYYAGIRRDELCALCHEGVVRAALLFDPSQPYQFATHFGPWLRVVVQERIDQIRGTPVPTRDDVDHLPSRPHEVDDLYQLVMTRVIELAPTRRAAEMLIDVWGLRTGEQISKADVGKMHGVDPSQVCRAIKEAVGTIADCLDHLRADYI